MIVPQVHFVLQTILSTHAPSKLRNERADSNTNSSITPLFRVPWFSALIMIFGTRLNMLIMLKFVLSQSFCRHEFSRGH